MGLFKNGVGRPSNETISKRRKVIFFIAVVVVSVLGTGMFLVINYLNNNQIIGKSKNIQPGDEKVFGAHFIDPYDKVESRACMGFTGCSIYTPDFTPQYEFAALGWATTRNSTKITIGINEGIVVSDKSTKKYYAVTRSEKEYYAIFTIGTGVDSIDGDYVKSCYRYNGEVSCSVKAPSIAAKTGYTVLGWATSPNATSASVKAGEKISLTSDKKYYTVTKATNINSTSRTFTATFYSNGSVGSTTTRTCKTTGNSCTITSPNISPKNGFITIGWGTSASSTTKSVGTGVSITLSGNKTYYAVTRSKSQYYANFIKGTGVSSIGFSKLGCYAYNEATSCSVKAPTITASSGYTVVGWSRDKTYISHFVAVGSTIELFGSVNYYTIVKPVSRTFTATFYPNGSNGSKIARSCKTTGTSCKITAPAITPKSGFSVVGWGTSSGSTTKSVGTNTTITLSNNRSYYAITKGSWTATFKKGANVSSIGYSSKTCYRYNGALNCQVLTPSITAKSGYVVSGWATYSGATSASYKVGSYITLSKNTTLYTAVNKK